MSLRTGSYAKVWKVENKGKYSVAEMSTSKKNKQTDKYETDWQCKFTRLVGTAHEQAKNFKDGESVKIGSFEVTNNYDKEKKIMYTNFTIFSFEDINIGNNNNANSKPKNNTSPVEDVDDDLPF